VPDRELDPADELLERQLREAVMEVWLRRKPQVLERVDFIAKCVSDLENGKIEEDVIAEAIVEAHRLAGAMGSFGFHLSSEFAREIELSLEGETWRQDGVVPLIVAINGIKSELDGS